MAIRIKRATWIAGHPVKVGEIIKTDDETARTLIQLEHAEIATQEEQTAKPARGK